MLWRFRPGSINSLDNVLPTRPTRTFHLVSSVFIHSASSLKILFPYYPNYPITFIFYLHVISSEDHIIRHTFPDCAETTHLPHDLELYGASMMKVCDLVVTRTKKKKRVYCIMASNALWCYHTSCHPPGYSNEKHLI